MEQFKKIGVVVADADEYRPVLQAVEGMSPQAYAWFKNSGISFTCGNTQVICLHSGIGKVNAACAAMHLIDAGCDLILNFGLSGGVSGVRRGNVVLPESFLEHDFDLTGIGYKPCEKPNQRYIYTADDEVRACLSKALSTELGGTAVCGDRFVCDDTLRAFLRDTFGATSCDMETAAIASACDFTGVPFASIRRISDDAGTDSYASYTEMNVNDSVSLTDIFLKGLYAVCGVKEGQNG